METENTFRDWLDARGITAQQAAQMFGVAEQTIANWRSAGVPERRRMHVEAVMASWQPTGSQPRLEATIVINPNISQLQAWHNAAQDQSKDLESWTVDGLDQLAEEQLSAQEQAGPTSAAAPPAAFQ